MKTNGIKKQQIFFFFNALTFLIIQTEKHKLKIFKYNYESNGKMYYNIKTFS